MSFLFYFLFFSSVHMQMSVPLPTVSSMFRKRYNVRNSGQLAVQMSNETPNKMCKQDLSPRTAKYTTPCAQ